MKIIEQSAAPDRRGRVDLEVFILYKKFWHLTSFV
jgi:hypothetical protein